MKNDFIDGLDFLEFAIDHWISSQKNHEKYSIKKIDNGYQIFALKEREFLEHNPIIEIVVAPLSEQHKFKIAFNTFIKCEYMMYSTFAGKKQVCKLKSDKNGSFSDISLNKFFSSIGDCIGYIRTIIKYNYLSKITLD